MLNLQLSNNEEVTTEDLRILELIKDIELKEYTLELLNQYGDQNKLDIANSVGDVVLTLCKRKGFVVPGVPTQKFIEVLYSAALLHNLFYDESDLTTLFKLRKVTYDLDMSSSLIDAVLQSVESHLGENTPVPMCKPAVNTPSELLATAVWIANEYCTPQA